MKRIEWPGIATAVGILLIGAIALDLSKWQPLLAALVALGGVPSLTKEPWRKYMRTRKRIVASFNGSGSEFSSEPSMHAIISPIAPISWWKKPLES
jgi:hypothetical protein